MLRIGQNHYQLVGVYSGFSVELCAKAEDVLGREQVWDLDLHYVPADRYTPRADGELEYLVLTIRSEEYAVADWRKLSGFDLDNDDDHWMGSVALENKMVGRYEQESWKVLLGWLEAERVRDYFFRCRFDGSRILADGTEEEMEFEEELPFREVVAYVPLNAADPVAVARKMAARMVGLQEIAGSRVQPYDPKKETYFDIRINSHHRVTLITPWQGSSSRGDEAQNPP